ncbi:TetR-like C-terminal domain-containing protein [Streptomyces sp. NPDC058637]|uniref:TetR-like C-terminal domain-containing protein n=1 Tax=Streptomyces sp. NPDC058637 TaxID=3346569 RepID=UPI0036479D40
MRRANSTWSSPYGEILRGLIAAAGSAQDCWPNWAIPRPAAWLTVLGRAVARGEAAPEAPHPRVASAPVALLRNECMTRGVPVVPDAALVEVVNEVFLPLVRGRGCSCSCGGSASVLTRVCSAAIVRPGVLGVRGGRHR